jgi:GTPase
MLPSIAIIGRPNVGKSTLFNVLTQSRQALVADEPGLTRDRQFALGNFEDKNYWVIDTGGLTTDADFLAQHIKHQVEQALIEADVILFLVDGRAGLNASDELIAQQLRLITKPIFLVVNKIESLQIDSILAEFYSLGFNAVYGISAAHKTGIAELMTAVLAELEWPEELINPGDSIKVAMLGRPNVGKSTLINRILGQERVIAYDKPGTTRDSIFIPFSRHGANYTLIDTAGIRRRARVEAVIEKFSIIKALQAIEQADVILLILDAQEGITDQDSGLLGKALELGRAIVIAVNKWDGLQPDERDRVRSNLQRKLHFIDFAKIHYISALHGTGVGQLFASINSAYKAATSEISTTHLNQLLQAALNAHPPPTVNGRMIKLRYIHQSGKQPPSFAIHGNQLAALPPSYQRYLMNYLRQNLEFTGTPIKLELRTTQNPYAGKKNPLNERQVRKRRRLLRHVKK